MSDIEAKLDRVIEYLDAAIQPEILERLTNELSSARQEGREAEKRMMSEVAAIRDKLDSSTGMDVRLQNVERIAGVPTPPTIDMRVDRIETSHKAIWATIVGVILVVGFTLQLVS